MKAVDDRLDAMLSAPLAPVVDAGFSARVLAKIDAPQADRWWLEPAAVAVAAGLGLAVLAGTGAFEWAGKIGYDFANSVPLAMAAVAVALTFSSVRLFGE